MQLALTILGSAQQDFIAEILPAISECQCNIVELRSCQLADAMNGYFLIEGNWNQIAKLENTLDSIAKRLNIIISRMRPKPSTDKDDLIPYSIETISIDKHDTILSVSNFLQDREVVINEMTVSRFQTSYIKTALFSCKFIIFIPPELRLLSLREEFLDFCDQLNIDAILEPIKR